ncbi:glycosyl transferase [Candidatus Vecturithrix granuli]|uniref:Glycosyl transferase n=1 Tax=Vecturithrix granuli TaxID=1499967 RepID=A0A081BY60_VECG1|nr:glycosyl transferase [Candidatus Vecturithrix granuli]
MKIVLCANTSWFIYNFCKSLCLAIKQKGHEVYVLSPFDQYTARLQQLGLQWFHINLHQTSKNPLKEIYSLSELLYFIIKIRPTFILTFTIKCNMYAGLLARIFPVRQIATIAGLGGVFQKKGYFVKFICWLYTRAFKHSPKIFFQNEEDLTFFLQHRIVSAKQSEKIPGLGVNLLRFTPDFSERYHKKRVFLMFGRILVSKGYDLFLQAASRIHADPSMLAEFWILGIRDSTRKDSEELFQKILAYHKRRIITYLPATEDVVPIIHQADVVVLPTEYNEGVPASLLEAMACGKPIITTNWKGCQETVDEEVNGFLIEKGDVESLLKAIKRCIQADNTILRQMGEWSRKKVEQQFDEQRVIAKYLSQIYPQS